MGLRFPLYPLDKIQVEWKDFWRHFLLLIIFPITTTSWHILSAKVRSTHPYLLFLSEKGRSRRCRAAKVNDILFCRPVVGKRPNKLNRPDSHRWFTTGDIDKAQWSMEQIQKWNKRFHFYNHQVASFKISASPQWVLSEMSKIFKMVV